MKIFIIYLVIGIIFWILHNISIFMVHCATLYDNNLNKKTYNLYKKYNKKHKLEVLKDDLLYILIWPIILIFMLLLYTYYAYTLIYGNKMLYFSKPFYMFKKELIKKWKESA